MWQKSKGKLDRLSSQLGQAVNSSLDREVNIAVTGLSRSGKTVLITSLVQQLLHGADSQALPFFALARDERIIGVRLDNQSLESPFPYATNLAALQSDPPRWPESTERLSQTRLQIRYRANNPLKRMVSEANTLTLNIFDYPGEWLLDLAMLELDFQGWCAQQRELFNCATRQSLAADWLAALEGIDWAAPADADCLKVLVDQYRELSLALQHREGMSFIQPGRLLVPGDLAGDQCIALFPLIAEVDWQQLESSPEDSYYHQLKDRYQRYCKEIVEHFYTQHFSRFDRQLVLVDCLKTLNLGKDCFDDMQLAINQVIKSFHYGSSSWWRRLFKPRIDRVLFACSKADHVTANQHHNLDQFLALVVDQARREMRFEGVNTHFLALASMRATEPAEASLDGQVISCLKGHRKDTGEPIALFPGEVPVELPRDEHWSSERFRFVNFAPKPLTIPTPGSHIRLDQALEFLLGDKVK